MRVAVAGASGFIGSALVATLVEDGADVVRLVRRPARDQGEVEWDPAVGTVDLDRLAGIDALVSLIGANVGAHRWTAAYRRELRESRVVGTGTLVRAISAVRPRPAVFVSGSAIGWYGSRGEEQLTEDSSPGEGFLAEMVRDWEAAARGAEAAGIRVVLPRSGLVMGAGGGAFGRLVRVIKLGAGGPLGGGRQWWSWITLDDETAALRHLLGSSLSGPVNLTSPEPARNAEVVRRVAAALHRPALLPAPAFALRAVLGQLADDIIGSARVLPTRLSADGFAFQHPTLDGAVTWLAEQSPGRAGGG